MRWAFISSLTSALERSSHLQPVFYMCRQCTRRFSSTPPLHRNNVRVRFAPSPTGDLHLGGLRTALYNYLFARKNDGTFIIRCEDTDQVRLVPGAIEKMLDMLSWMGISPDEGPFIGGHYGPYIQSERLELYRKWVDHLVSEGHAYKCFCSPQRLELLRKDQIRRRENFQGYDNSCRQLSSEKIDAKLSSHTPYVIRFKLRDCIQTWNDLVYGEFTCADLSKVEGDPVLLKSDGFPTYHFANVVDDHHMKISHVLRGAEWHSSTPKHLQIFSAFGWKPPIYAHLPLLLNEDGTKLSKRQDSLKVEHLKSRGYEPESIITLLSLSGGGISISHKDLNEHGVSLQSAIERFSVDRTKRESSVLEIKRLDTINQSCINRMYRSESKEVFCSRIARIAAEKGFPSSNLDHHIYDKFLEYSDRLSTLSGLFEGDFQFLWQRPADVSKPLTDIKGVTLEECVKVIQLMKDTVTSSHADNVMNTLISQTKFKKPTLYKIIRISLTGSEVGPPIIMLFDLLDAEEIATRCSDAVACLVSSQEH